MVPRIVLGFAFTVFFAACGDDPRPCPNDLPTPDAGVCDTSFGNDVFPLIMTRCYPCHGPGGIEQSKHDFTSYTKIFSQRTQILTQVHACRMPPIGAPDLDTMQRFLLQSWLVCGAQNN